MELDAPTSEERVNVSPTDPSQTESPLDEDVHSLADVHLTESSTDCTAKRKVDVLLKATGDAPIMKKKKWAVDQDKPIGWITEFLRKYLKLDSCDSLFLYVNQSFAPAPDHLIRNLYDCFGSDGKLVLHYCKTQAWG